jgi:hypothetical protein
MQRMGMVLGLKPDKVAEYVRLHASVWPDVLAMISACISGRTSTPSRRECWKSDSDRPRGGSPPRTNLANSRRSFQNGAEAVFRQRRHSYKLQRLFQGAVEG